MPECYIRGTNIKTLRMPDDILLSVKEEQVSSGDRGRGRGFRGGDRGGRGGPGGRGGGGRGNFSMKQRILSILFPNVIK